MLKHGAYNGFASNLSLDSDIKFIDDTAREPLSRVSDKKCPEFSYEDHPVYGEVLKIRRLLRWFRCSFTCSDTPCTININRLVMGTVMTIQTYGVIYLIYVLSTYSIDNKALTSTLVRVMYNMQSVVSMTFLYWWQREGRFRRYALLLHEAQGSVTAVQHKCQLGRLALVLYGILFVVFCFIIFTQAVIFLDVEVEIFDHEMIARYREYKLVTVVLFMVQAYAFICTSTSIFLYATFTYGAVLEVSHFNARLDKVGHPCGENILEDLMRLINDQAKLSAAIRALDSMCEVYAFIMIGSTIPIAVFSSLQLMSTKGMPLINVVLTAPLIMICLAQLVSLTSIPAMLHNVLDRSKHHLYENTIIWRRFDSHIFQVANSLAAHLNQPDLGVSVWGFAVVSKPLILTTISVMVTCMAFVLELRRRPSA